MTVPVRRCFYLFSLRQGTMLIGIFVLLLSGFCLFLLLLGSAHAHEMATMLEADIEDSAEREGIVLSDENGPVEIHSQNEIVLHKAHNLAVLVIVWLYLGVALATVHLVLCILLLCGAILRVRKLLLPWMCVAMVGLILCCTAMLVSMYLVRGYGALVIFLTATVVIVFGFYLWLIVYSHYMEIGEAKNCTVNATTHHTFSDRYHLFRGPNTTYV
ncbi:uncharacterized protein LOC106673744 [Cimex lectularius]|uniref:Uncharacterized protein n=1 Tax=Cimex lectularius TaxID=79782 RepID=A0A8I6SBM3_CIMLE|nr:uncharacterized protein LOC106673744 [Cimex lectularius]XP_014261444.1 uncharacterized protein LOC106673744 [Cimex lectularius]